MPVPLLLLLRKRRRRRRSVFFLAVIGGHVGRSRGGKEKKKKKKGVGRRWKREEKVARARVLLRKERIWENATRSPASEGGRFGRGREKNKTDPMFFPTLEKSSLKVLSWYCIATATARYGWLGRRLTTFWKQLLLADALFPSFFFFFPLPLLLPDLMIQQSACRRRHR